MRPDFLNLPHELFKRLGKQNGALFVKLLEITGHQIAFWTINSEAQWDDVYSYSDVVITDEVSQALSWRQKSE